MTPPRYESAVLEIVAVHDLPQLAGPRANYALTVCLACSAAVRSCACTPADRTAAVAILHQELVAGRDPDPALKRWRAERLAASGQSADLADLAHTGDQVGGELRGQG